MLGGTEQERGATTRFAVTVALSTAAVAVVAALQHRFIVGVELHARLFVFPVAVGLVFGVLLALVRAARARERAARERIAAHEAEILRLNADLEARVAARTAELEQKTEALLRAQKLEVMGLLAGGVAHDFNNVLAAVLACAEELRAALPGVAPAGREGFALVLGELDAGVERGRRLAQQLVTLGRSGTARGEAVDLAALARDVAPMLRRLVGERIAVAVTAGEAPCPVRGDRAQLEQLVLNLATNARDAMPDGGTLSLGVERAGREIFLVVADTGEGMDEETRARMFEPYFTTRARRGNGLGGMVVQEVARRWAERLDVDSAPRRGTRVCVTFQALEPGPSGPARQAQGTSRPYDA